MTERKSHYREEGPWQFSLLSLLGVMTLLAFGLALYRSYPVVSITFLFLSGLGGILLVADVFVRHADKRAWKRLILAAWIVVALFVITMIAAFALLLAST
jgi:lipopolysaccharide export LptBFGC system permease protein LptF